MNLMENFCVARQLIASATTTTAVMLSIIVMAVEAVVEPVVGTVVESLSVESVSGTSILSSV